MKYVLVLILAFITFGPAYCYDCDDISELRQKLSAASSNYMNAFNTRTPRGGFYKKKIITGCKNGKCSTVSLNRYLTKFDPKHPDADSKGYVKYPEISRESELTSIDKMVKKLKKMARQKVCQTKLLVHKKNRNVFMIRYGEDPVSDRFVVKQNKIYSWTINSPLGKDTIKFN